MAYSLIGVNSFYGTPLNPKAPDRVPGGSSSGSASAVASELVDFAINSIHDVFNKKITNQNTTKKIENELDIDKMSCSRIIITLLITAMAWGMAGQALAWTRARASPV